MAKSNEEKAAEWRQTIADYDASGMKTAAFCREREIAIHQFHYWRKRLTAESRETATSGGFIRLDDDESASAGVMLLTGSYRIAVSAGFCATTLSRTLAVLQAQGR